MGSGEITKGVRNYCSEREIEKIMESQIIHLDDKDTIDSKKDWSFNRVLKKIATPYSSSINC